jgi:hypothetical protein
MPSFFIFHCNVERLIPRRAAAPFDPPTTQPFREARRIGERFHLLADTSRLFPPRAFADMGLARCLDRGLPTGTFLL